MDINYLDRDDFWEERLSEDKRRFYFAKFRHIDHSKLAPAKLNLEFFHQTRPALSKVLARDFNLLWQYSAQRHAHKNFLYFLSKVKINVHDPHSWASANPRIAPKWRALPAIRFLLVNDLPLIELILPLDVLAKLEANPDIRINLLRLFVGEVLGKLMFDWAVLNRFPFSAIKKKNINFEPSFVEKAIIARLFSLQDLNIRQMLKNIGKAYSNNDEQKINFAATHFFYDAIYRQKINPHQTSLINSWFTGFLDWINKNFTDFNLLLVNNFQKKQRFLRLFLPPEKAAVFNLLKTSSLQFIRLVVEKNNFLYHRWLSLIDVINSLALFPELSKQLVTPLFDDSQTTDVAQHPGELSNTTNLLDSDSLQHLILLASSIQKSLVEKDLAYGCLLPNDLASNQDKKNFLSFKLWLHTNFYAGLGYATKINAAKINNYLVNQYRKSAFQVLYNFCECLKKLAQHKLLQTNKNTLRPYLIWYVRNRQEMELINVLGEFYLVLEDKKKYSQRQHLIEERLAVFRKGWANFFANSFLMYYAQNNTLPKLELLKNINFNRFKLLIYRSSLENLYQHSTALTALFIHLFRMLNEDLTKMFKFLDPGDPLVDSWILNGMPDKFKRKQYILQIAKKIANRIF